MRAELVLISLVHPSGNGLTIEPDDQEALEQAYRYGLQLLDDLEAKRSRVAKRCWAISEQLDKLREES